MLQFSKVCDVIERILIVIISICAAIMITITTIEVVRRYAFSLSYQWAEELSRYLMIGLAFLGAAVAYRKKDLIPLDLITNYLPAKVRLIVEIIMESISVIILVMLLYLSYNAVTSPVVYKQISIGLPISMAIPFSTMPISFVCMIIFAIEHFLKIPSKFKEVK